MTTSISKTVSSSTTTIILQEVGGTYGTPQIQSIRNAKDAQLVFMPIPNKDSDGAIGFDLYGVKREITLQGFVTGTPVELQGFITAMEGFINGAQWSSDNKSLSLKIDFNTELSYDVLMKNFFWTWEKGIPDRINYTVIFTEIDPDQGA